MTKERPDDVSRQEPLRVRPQPDAASDPVRLTADTTSGMVRLGTVSEAGLTMPRSRSLSVAMSIRRPAGWQAANQGYEGRRPSQAVRCRLRARRTQDTRSRTHTPKSGDEWPRGARDASGTAAR